MPPLAYIDPGSGSLLLQAIIAALVAVPFVFRRTIGGFWHRLRGGDSSDEPGASAASVSDDPSPTDR